MSPFQHGEVFVTEDGAETDLDLGHYERFIDENLSRNASHTRRRDLGHGAAQGAQGRVPRRDGAGDPAHHERDQGAHPPRRAGAARRRRHLARSAARSATSSRCRSSRRSASSGARSGRRTSLYLHVTLVPFIEAAGELKTKPTQHSVNELRRIGIHPDIVVCRSRDAALRRHPREDRALRRRRRARRDRLARRARRLPRPGAAAGARGSTRSSASGSASTRRRPSSASGRSSTDRIAEPREDVEIALVGKYVKLHDAYLSVHEALKHAGVHQGAQRARALGRRREHVLRGGGARSSTRSTACSSRAASARAAGRARSSPAGSRASGGSRTSASASACTSRSRSSRATSAASTAPTRPRWTPRRRTR